MSVIEPLPHAQEYKVFTYRASALRSPFPARGQAEWLRPATQVTQLEPAGDSTQQAFTGFNIDSFTMVGLLANNQTSYALLRSSGGVKRVAVGDYLDDQDAQVTAITASSVEIVERVAEGDGERVERTHTLVLLERS